jgi:N-acetylmuramoyl-L-alanine amidase
MAARIIAAGLAVLVVSAGTTAAEVVSIDQPPAARTCQWPDFKIAIDVGHTREAPGATSARGVPEFDFNLRLARLIEGTLRDAGFNHTYLLIERGIGRPQLLRRTARANRLQVDLFLSIHHDDVPDAYHAKWEYQGKTHLFSDRSSGFSLFVSTLNKAADASLEMAKLLGAELVQREMRINAGHAEDVPGERRELLDATHGVYRYDDLIVLQYTQAPAVLLEAGVIVNRNEELQLASFEHQRQISAALLNAIDRYCNARRAKPAG